ncbi:MAG: type II toxin-antitoxin system HicB family antitoxin, partial [Clostridiales bacterium]|nr:type II toxin-antitoxin system HicB family antitoxin [Clostridiales bacterium]
MRLSLYFKEVKTMKEAYPIIISEESDGYYVSIPDFNIATQGSSIADSISMARDAIGLM